MDRSATPKWLFFVSAPLRSNGHHDSILCMFFFTIINYFSLSIYLSINGIGRFSTQGRRLLCAENHIAEVKTRKEFK